MSHREWTPRSKESWQHKKEYLAWFNMMDRCYNPAHHNYPNYGARGITVCEAWHSFHNFLAEMGSAPTQKHSLDRYPDNNGNYEPGNCRWATAGDQARNRRNTLLVPWQGKMIPAVDLAVILGKDPLPYARRVWLRINRYGYTPEEAVRDETDGRSGQKRRANSTLIQIDDGPVISLQEAAELLEIDYKTVNQRYYRGATLAGSLGLPDTRVTVIQEVRRPRRKE